MNSHRPTPDAVVHHPDGTPIMTRPHRTLKKKKFDGWIFRFEEFGYLILQDNYFETRSKILPTPIQ